PRRMIPKIRRNRSAARRRSEARRHGGAGEASAGHLSTPCASAAPTQSRAGVIEAQPRRPAPFFMAGRPPHRAGGGSSNGRTADSDSASLGSNPSPPASSHDRLITAASSLYARSSELS